MKLVGLIKIYLNETYSKIHTCKNVMHFLHRMAQKKTFFATTFKIFLRTSSENGIEWNT